MSKERVLLKEFIDFVDSYEFYPTERNIIFEIVNRANAILAQPEQPSTPRHALDSYWESESYQRGYAVARKDYKQKVINAFGVDDEH